MFSQNGFRDLIKDYGIKSTRNEFAWVHPVKLMYSDYVYVGGDIKVKSFDVPYMKISDHLPLIVELEI
jgi:endonuclease/exonuclease/phosphatase family metal-dependent hydrolase